MWKGAKIQRRIRLSSRKRVLESKTSVATEAVKSVSTVPGKEDLSFPLDGHLYTLLAEALKSVFTQLFTSELPPSHDMTSNFSVNKLTPFWVQAWAL